MRFFKLFFLTILTASSLLIFTSCGDDDDGGDTGTDTCSEALATGSINGKAFEFQAGNAFDVSDGIAFNMFSTDVTIMDLCTFRSDFGDDAVSIRGTFPNSTVGRTDLFLSADLSEGFTLNLFDAEGFTNNFASEGFVEITGITDTTITGFLSAEAGDDEVCGTFELTRCQ